MGCIPEPVNKVVGSFSGIREAEGKIACALDLKKSMYFWRISLTVIMRAFQTKIGWITGIGNGIDPANCGRLPKLPSVRQSLTQHSSWQLKPGLIAIAVGWVAKTPAVFECQHALT